MIPWEQAVQVGGVGFGMVFLLLVILAIVIWLTGLALNRRSHRSEITEKKEGE